MKPYYVYMIRCADDSLYTGITTDPARRFEEHKSGTNPHSKYTRTHPPVRFERLWTTPTRGNALRLEARIKALPKARKEELAASPDRLECFFEDLDPAAFLPAELSQDITD